MVMVLFVYSMRERLFISVLFILYIEQMLNLLFKHLQTLDGIISKEGSKRKRCNFRTEVNFNSQVTLQ